MNTQQLIEEVVGEFRGRFLTGEKEDQKDDKLHEAILEPIKVRDFESFLKSSLSTIASKSAQKTTREIIDAYIKNTGIEDDLFIQFLEVMHDYYKESQ